jgi:hypothetical protein
MTLPESEPTVLELVERAKRGALAMGHRPSGDWATDEKWWDAGQVYVLFAPPDRLLKIFAVDPYSGQRELIYQQEKKDRGHPYVTNNAAIVEFALHTLKQIMVLDDLAGA